MDSREAAAQADGNRRRDRLESGAAETGVVEGDKSGEEFGRGQSCAWESWMDIFMEGLMWSN